MSTRNISEETHARWISLAAKSISLEPKTDAVSQEETWTAFMALDRSDKVRAFRRLLVLTNGLNKQQQAGLLLRCGQTLQCTQPQTFQMFCTFWELQRRENGLAEEIIEALKELDFS